MLLLTPDAVDRNAIQDDPDRTPGKVFTYVVPQTSTNGVTGAPSQATVAEGEQLLIQMGEALTTKVKAAMVEQPPIRWSRQQLADLNPENVLNI
jgi:creatinine amidohydrolase